jgi:hypothetical protein
VLSVGLWLKRRDPAARLAWTLACAFYLMHVAAAFQFHHHWSHLAAYRETAQQTAEVFGLNWGGGLYFNYAFTIVWIADALWWWRIGLDGYRAPPSLGDWSGPFVFWIHVLQRGGRVRIRFHPMVRRRLDADADAGRNGGERFTADVTRAV